MNACITQETFVFTVFRWVFHSTLKLELCRHACRRWDPIISTCWYGKNMPTTALDDTLGKSFQMTQEGYQVIIILAMKSKMAAAKKQCFLLFLYWTESSPPSFKVLGLQMTINLALM